MEVETIGMANGEADHYADAGLALIPRLTEGPERRSLELALYLARANALLPLRGYSAPETIAALTDAKRLLDLGVGTDLQHFSVLKSNRWRGHLALPSQTPSRDNIPNFGFRKLPFRSEICRSGSQSAGASLGPGHRA